MKLCPRAWSEDWLFLLFLQCLVTKVFQEDANYSRLPYLQSFDPLSWSVSYIIYPSPSIPFIVKFKFELIILIICNLLWKCCKNILDVVLFFNSFTDFGNHFFFPFPFSVMGLPQLPIFFFYPPILVMALPLTNCNFFFPSYFGNAIATILFFFFKK